MKLHFIIHESFEAPAAIELWAKRKNFELSYTRLHAGDSFPTNTDFDFLIIMGGPQCPTTSKEECPHFDSKAEIAFIQKALSADKHILGVCLGAQFIGQALGASFEHSPNREIGVFPLTLTEDGKRDPLIGQFPPQFKVAHWHGDMPGLTTEATVLAFSEGCPRQIVRYGPKIYGFQCHFEFTADAVKEMIKFNASELNDYKDLPYIQTADELLGQDYREMNGFLFQFLDAFVETE